MKVPVIPIVIVALGTDTKELVKELEDLEIRGRVETIQTIELRLARILRRVLETWRNLLPLQTPVEDHQLMLVWNSQMSIMINF